MTIPASSYILEFSVGAAEGGRADLFTYNDWEHLLACLHQELANPQADAHRAASRRALTPRQTMAIWTIEAGIVVGVLDLRPFVTVQMSEAAGGHAPGGPFPLDAIPEAVGAALERGGDGPDATFALDEEFLAEALQPLDEPLLRPGQQLSVQDPYGLFATMQTRLTAILQRPLPYGHFDLLEGKAGTVQGWVDPDPAG